MMQVSVNTIIAGAQPRGGDRCLNLVDQIGRYLRTADIELDTSVVYQNRGG
jgi:hypothetical protein